MTAQMVVKEIKPDGNRSRIYGDDMNYYVIGNHDRIQGIIQVGDTIEYELLRPDYGQFLRKVENAKQN